MKRKILFLYNHEYPDLWRDGLYAAIMRLSFDFTITTVNLFTDKIQDSIISEHNFVLGWGAFNSPVDRRIQEYAGNTPCGLCIAGVAAPPDGMDRYNVLFYETEWYKDRIIRHPFTVHAFGYNSKIYKVAHRRKFWDFMTVGAFSLWKRQHLLCSFPGSRIAIGEIQKGNPQESLGIVAKLLAHGVMVSDMVDPLQLAEMYRMSNVLYIPADIFGGGERAVLEGRASGIEVQIEPDNPKLKELLTSPLYDDDYYYRQLKGGIEECLKI